MTAWGAHLTALKLDGNNMQHEARCICSSCHHQRVCVAVRDDVLEELKTNTWDSTLADNVIRAALLCFTFEQGGDFYHWSGDSWYPGCGRPALFLDAPEER